MQVNQIQQLAAEFHSIIFINEEKSLVIEIDKSWAIRELNNGVQFYLFQDNDAAPFMLTEKSKEAVIDFLNRKYSQHSQMKRLINWFQRMRAGEYLYIYPYIDSGEYLEFCDMLKESLKYYNEHRGEEYVYRMMLNDCRKMEQRKKFLQGLHYEILYNVPSEKKIYLGEPDIKKRVCIYCKKSAVNREATFKEKAHAISEAIGNKVFIQNEECDYCNSFFAENMEEDLCNYLWLTRLKYGIKGKYGYPTFQLENQYARYIDTEQADANWGKFEVLRGRIKNPYKGPAIIGTDKISELEYLDIRYIKGYIPLHVYKSLVKYAIGLMDDKSMRSHFEETISWLREGDIFRPLPKVIIFNHSRIVYEPELYLFKRRGNVSCLPYCYGELRIGDRIIVFILPFCELDDRNYTQDHDFKYFVKVCLSIYSTERIYEDFSSVDETSLEVSLKMVNGVRIEEIFEERK